jgi:iron complex transport system ATP-binding protein
MSATAIELKNVSYRYEAGFCLSNISCALEAGSFSFILGPNGAGKTTIFKLASGIVKPGRGELKIFDRPYQDISRAVLAQRIAVVEQDPAYIFPFTVEELVLMGRYPHSSAAFFETDADIAKAEWAMQLTGTTQFRHRPIQSLSGGERRRVEIARALAQEADIILLDEPASHLDIKQQRDLFRMLARLNEEKGITLWVISHHVYLVREYASHIHFMREGTIFELTDKAILANETELIDMF